MNNEPSENLIKFPCDFPIKIFGKASFEFESAVVTIIHKHIPNLSEGAIKLKFSNNEKYLAITALVPVKNQEQLDALYQELVASKLVIMVL
jgi:uncharacterized protein